MAPASRPLVHGDGTPGKGGLIVLTSFLFVQGSRGPPGMPGPQGPAGQDVSEGQGCRISPGSCRTAPRPQPPLTGNPRGAVLPHESLPLPHQGFSCFVRLLPVTFDFVLSGFTCFAFVLCFQNLVSSWVPHAHTHKHHSACMRCCRFRVLDANQRRGGLLF